TSRFTIGTSTRIENVSLFGFLIFSSAGAGGGASSVLFFGSTIPSVPVSGPALSSVVVGGVGFCCCAGGLAGVLCAHTGDATTPARVNPRPTANNPARFIPAAPTPFGHP